MTEQYRKAARAVLALVGDDPETHLREATRLVSEDKIEESLSRLRRACPFAKNEVIQVLRLVITQTILARGDVPPWGDDAFLLLTRLDPQDDIAFNNWGNHLTRLAEMVWKDKRKTAEKYFRDAEKRLREAVSLAPEKEAYRKNLVTMLKLWADKLEESGDTRAAEKKREEAEGVSSTPAPDRKKKKPKKRPARPRTARK